ncbi:P-loop containing nucleoside triphosphate hydrolase protein [Phycomyces nitens]|nr:P-loop containing nucleoside triphosphate hydrolase protein [Phycomyces nitens]
MVLACWDTPPPVDSEYFPAYKEALRRYQLGQKIQPPAKMKIRIEEVRAVATRESYAKHELKKQPDFIKGGTLMPHQLDGLNWMLYQWERGQPCILADDMGLGKTIQMVVFVYYLLKKFGIYPFAIVVPNSTAENWLREFNKWAPDMVVVPYHGTAKARELARKHEIFTTDNGTGNRKIRCHAVILTYESALSDIGYFKGSVFWPGLVVDEAHRLKNDASLLFQKLHSLNFNHSVLLTGTPLQNNIRELMNIMHFIDPPKFKNLKDLEDKYGELSHETVQELHEQLKPYFLRRTKKNALKDLPPKSEIIVPVSMTSLQKEVYKNILSQNIVSFANFSVGEKPANNASRASRNILMDLRKTLNHPYLIDGIEVEQSSPDATHRALIDACGKLRILHQMLPRLKRDGHRVLIFSTLRLTLDVLEDYLRTEDYKYLRLDGSCSQLERIGAIDSFNAPNSKDFVFLLTTRAGGVGINLATADTVIVWDPDSNPHADMQAISRAHRIGQKNPVLVLKFMTRLSAEEKIVHVAKKKMVLDHLVVDKMDDDGLESNDIESILKYGSKALFEGDNSKDISYDSTAIDKLLDRSNIVKQDSEAVEEATDDGEKPLSFSFAKVWSSGPDASGEEKIDELADDRQEDVDTDFWNRFLESKRNEKKKIKEADEELGRGARRRAKISYFDEEDQRKNKHSSKKGKEVDNRMSDNEDPEFVARGSENEDDDSVVSMDSDHNLVSVSADKTTDGTEQPTPPVHDPSVQGQDQDHNQNQNQNQNKPPSSRKASGSARRGRGKIIQHTSSRQKDVPTSFSQNQLTYSLNNNTYLTNSATQEQGLENMISLQDQEEMYKHYMICQNQLTTLKETYQNTDLSTSAPYLKAYSEIANTYNKKITEIRKKYAGRSATGQTAAPQTGTSSTQPMAGPSTTQTATNQNISSILPPMHPVPVALTHPNPNSSLQHLQSSNNLAQQQTNFRVQLQTQANLERKQNRPKKTPEEKEIPKTKTMSKAQERVRAHEKIIAQITLNMEQARRYVQARQPDAQGNNVASSRVSLNLSSVDDHTQLPALRLSSSPTIETEQAHHSRQTQPPLNNTLQSHQQQTYTQTQSNISLANLEYTHKSSEAYLTLEAQRRAQQKALAEQWALNRATQQQLGESSLQDSATLQYNSRPSQNTNDRVDSTRSPTVGSMATDTNMPISQLKNNSEAFKGGVFEKVSKEWNNIVYTFEAGHTQQQPVETSVNSLSTFTPSFNTLQTTSNPSSQTNYQTYNPQLQYFQQQLIQQQKLKLQQKQQQELQQQQQQQLKLQQQQQQELQQQQQLKLHSSSN